VFAALGLICAALLLTVGRRWLPTLFDTPDDLVADLRFAITLFAVQVVADLVTNATESCLEGLQRVDLSRGVDAARRTSVAVATCVAAVTVGDLRAVAVASLAVSLPSMLVGLAVLWRHLLDHHLAVVGAEARALLSYGKSVALLRPFGVIQRSMDRLIVGAVLGPAPVALVEIATQIQNGADAVLSASSYSVIPGASWLRARDDRRSLRELLERGTKYSLLVTLPCVIGPMILAGPLVQVWVGDEYAAAAGLAAVGLLYVAATAPLSVGSNLLVGVGRASAVLRAVLYAVPVNLVASLVLVHLVGTVGVFLGTLIGTAVLLGPLGRAVVREVDTSAAEFLRTAVAPVVAPGLALAAVAGLALLAPLGDLATLVVGFGAGGLAYAVVALWKSLTTSELQELRAALRRPPAAQERVKITATSSS
jgi:PST family polysaccharide transporter